MVLSHLLRRLSLARQEGKSHPPFMNAGHEAIDPYELWNSIQTWSKVHREEFTSPW